MLEKGEVVETGTHAELLERKGLYYAMWRQQIGERSKEEIYPPKSLLLAGTPNGAGASEEEA